MSTLSWCCIIGFAMIFAGFMGGWGWIWLVRQLNGK